MSKQRANIFAQAVDIAQDANIHIYTLYGTLAEVHHSFCVINIAASCNAGMLQLLGVGPEVNNQDLPSPTQTETLKQCHHQCTIDEQHPCAVCGARYWAYMQEDSKQASTNWTGFNLRAAWASSCSFNF